MTGKSHKQSDAINDSAVDTDGNVDKIREILFGGQMRDYERRFDQLEQRFAQLIERASSELESRIGDLESRLETLSERVKEESDARTEDLKSWDTELNDIRKHMESGLSEVESQIEKEAKSLKLALIDQSEELTATKLGKRDIVELLTEAASRINNDL